LGCEQAASLPRAYKDKNEIDVDFVLSSATTALDVACERRQDGADLLANRRVGDESVEPDRPAWHRDASAG
jgi:hypothetical protein